MVGEKYRGWTLDDVGSRFLRNIKPAKKLHVTTHTTYNFETLSISQIIN
jgi:hypothetical protein